MNVKQAYRTAAAWDQRPSRTLMNNPVPNYVPIGIAIAGVQWFEPCIIMY